MAHDNRLSRLSSGLLLAILSAGAFGMAGSLARGLMDSGWSAGSATIARVGIGAAVLLIPGILALRGQWHVMRTGWKPILGYGLFAVAAAQLAYFQAVRVLDVGIALLIEYMAPVLVIAWMWARHGSKPTRVTVIGAAIAVGGLALLLNIGGGATLHMGGVGWACIAMFGCAAYFVISGDETNGLPPLTLAAGGLVVAFLVLTAAGVGGILPMSFSAAPVVMRTVEMPWWLVAGMLGVIAAAIAYVAGIAATRRLGARLASFVALLEVVAASAFAWLFLGQGLVGIQWIGAALILAGVIVVKAGEPSGQPVGEPEDAIIGAVADEELENVPAAAEVLVPSALLEGAHALPVAETVPGPLDTYTPAA